MEFQDLIEEYNKEYRFFIKDDTDNFDGPVYKEGEPTEYLIDAAIFPLTAKQVQRYEGLGYTTQDIKVYLIPPVNGLNVETDTEEEVTLKEDDEVEYKGDKYTLDMIQDRTTHADFVYWIAVKGGSND